LLEFCFTVPVICSIDAAVCCSESVCVAVRSESEVLSRLICEEVLATVVVPVRTSLTTLKRQSFRPPSTCMSWPNSSRRVLLQATVRSPAMIWRAASSASRTGATTLRTSHQASAIPQAMAVAPSATIQARALPSASVAAHTVFSTTRANRGTKPITRRVRSVKLSIFISSPGRNAKRDARAHRLQPIGGRCGDLRGRFPANSGKTPVKKPAGCLA
jgi:hypothetical protein